MSTLPEAQVHIVNRGGKRSAKKKKKGTKMRRNKKGQFVKGGGGGKRRGKKRRSNPEPASNPRRRGGKRRGGRRRSHNPVGRFAHASINFRSATQHLLPVIAGRLWLAYAVRNWGGDWGTSVLGAPTPPGTPPPASPFAGQQWGFQGYAVGVIASYIGARIIERWKPGWGFHFFRGAIENMATRVVWTEGIARSEWGQKNFGQTAMVADDSRGNRMVLTPQGWQYMMGPMGQLQTERPLDGLEPARPLDGLERAGSKDVKHGGIGGRRYYGHFLPPGTDDKRARYEGSGSTSSYHSAYQRAY